MVTTVAVVTQQHVLSITFTSTDATTRMQRGLGPCNASLYDRYVEKHLRQGRDGHKWLLPPLHRSLLHGLVLLLIWTSDRNQIKHCFKHRPANLGSDFFWEPSGKIPETSGILSLNLSFPDFIRSQMGWPHIRQHNWITRNHDNII